jgi:hypothetical protein
MAAMEQFWRQLGWNLGKRWYVVLVVALAITAALAPGLSRLEFATGQDSYLNPESREAVDNVVFQDAFGGEAVVLLFTMDEGRSVDELFTPANIATLQDVEDELAGIGEVQSVITPLTALRWSEAIANGPGTAALASAAARDPDPDGQAARNADIGVSLARLNAVTDRSLEDPAWVDFLLWGNDGYTTSDAGAIAPADAERVVRLSLQSTFPTNNVAVGGVVLTGNASLDELSAGTDAVLDVMEGVELEGVETISTGSPVYLKEINDYLQSGMLTLGGLALVVMAVILFLMFRVRWRLLPLLAVVVGVVWAFSLLGYLGIALSLVTISGLPILIGMGIDFALQVHNRVEEEVVLDKETHPISETAANVGPPLVVAVIGCVLAFLALRVSRVPMIRDFGVLLAIGIVVLLVVGIAIPLTVLGAREWHRRTKTREETFTERLVVKLGSLPTRWVPVMAVVALVLVVAGLSLENRTKIQSDPVRWIDQGSQVVADIETLDERTGFSTTLGILIESNNVLAPEVSQVLTEFVFDAEARPEVSVSSSLVGTMAKIIAIPGGSPLAPTPEDLAAALEVAPPGIRRALVNEDGTAAQVNLRLAASSLEDRSVLVRDLERDLEARLGAVDLADDTVLTVGLAEGDDPIRAVPAGLAVVGVGLLENLTANRALLTYLALAAVSLLLVLRFRSLIRTLLTLVPVLLGVGASSLVVSLLGIELSPLTTVSGPLIIASCVEFAVLITGRYVEERERGLTARQATDVASARTGRAFFASAATTVGGFATLVVSPLPLLRDFGLIVTLNVAIALLAALVAMPPLLVWADEKGWFGLGEGTTGRSVRLAAPARGPQFVAAGVVGLGLAATVVAMVLGSRADEATAAPSTYEPVALPTPEPTPTPAPTEEAAVLDPADFGADRPEGVVGGTLFDLLTGQGVPANQAVCTAETLLSRISEADLLASGIATFSDEALVPVVQAGLDCQIPQDVIDATIAAARGG